jgi:capsid protein
MILDQYGQALVSASSSKNLQNRLLQLKRENMHLKARFDAAATTLANEGHWANADHFDPHTTASLNVRQRLRSRSRYEVLENNPYLKGTLLTICNDFVGTGPKLKILDKRISKEGKKKIESRWNDQYFKLCKGRQKLWRMRMAKFVDGETFAKLYLDNQLDHPINVNARIYETDQITSPSDDLSQRYNEIDGLRFDDFENVIEYYILKYHPGGSPMTRILAMKELGDWIKAKWVIHWFRQDRGWLRGIPETTPSLPLCSVLRRYTMAILRHAEVEADLTAVIQTDGPPNPDAWPEGDDPFDSFPVEPGLIVTMPWGYKLQQIDAVPLGVQFDEFVGCILREITRPLLSPYNIVIGSSKDANMSSSVVDIHIYKESQDFERLHCNEDVLDPWFTLWFKMGVLTPGYFTNIGNALRGEVPLHTFTWDRIGLDHTDPQKVATALQILKDAKIMTDRDIQEGYYNRNVDDWREEVMEDDKFRESLPSQKAERQAALKPSPTAGGKPKPKSKTKASARRIVPPINGNHHASRLILN